MGDETTQSWDMRMKMPAGRLRGKGKAPKSESAWHTGGKEKG